MGKDPGRASASARLGGGGRTSPPGTDKEAAVRAALGLVRPGLTDLPLDQEVTVRTVGVTFCLLLTRGGWHQALVPRLFAESSLGQTIKSRARTNVRPFARFLNAEASPHAPRPPRLRPTLAAPYAPRPPRRGRWVLNVADSATFATHPRPRRRRRAVWGLDLTPAGQAAAGRSGRQPAPRGKSGHRRAGWSGDRPGESRGKVPQKQTA